MTEVKSKIIEILKIKMNKFKDYIQTRSGKTLLVWIIGLIIIAVVGPLVGRISGSALLGVLIGATFIGKTIFKYFNDQT
jgi:hypothetical protein